MPLVSVIIPTYNRAAYLPATLDSVLAQTFKDFEVIVVDDGSTDGTPDVLEHYANRIRCHFQSNQHEGAARNNGIRHSSGDLLAFLDSDDVWLPQKLEADVDALTSTPTAALAYSRVECISGDGRRLGPRRLPSPQGDVLVRLACENFVPLSTTVVRRAAFETAGLFNPDPMLSGCIDWEAWIRLAADHPFVHVPRVTTLLRVHGRNMQSDGLYMERSVLRAVELTLTNAKLQARLSGYEARIWSSAFLAIAVNHCSNGATTRARHFLWRAGQTWPKVMLTPRWLVTFCKSMLGAGLILRLQQSKADLASLVARRRGLA